MKACIIYESKYGNGKQCVDYLAKQIHAKDHEVKTVSIRDSKPSSLPESDVYIFSSPTNFGGPPRKVKKFLKNIKLDSTDVKYALMATSMPPDQPKTLEKMEEILQNKGFTKITDGLNIRVKEIKGPLEDNYEKKLESFAKEIFN